MNDPEQFDGLYMTVLQKGQGIENFFDSFYGFLYRKTDFFADKEKSYEYIDSNFKRYLKKFEEKREKDDKKKKKEEDDKKKQKEQSASVREITQEEFDRKKNEEKLISQNQQVKDENSMLVDIEKKTPEVKEEDKIAEGKIKPGPGNGGVLDKYSWTQHDIKEINISIPISSNIRGKDLNVKYDAKEILVEIKGQDPIIKGEFFNTIKPGTFLWSLEEVKNGKVITITFEKSDTYKWWESIVKGDIAIDTTKINPEPSKLSDIEDPEMKAQIDKMMFDTRQKQMGKPTSDELQKNDMMGQFMKAHPEMDFSKCKFN